MMNGYLALLLTLAILVGMILGLLVVSHFLGPRRPNLVKGEPYECGIIPVGDARGRFPIRFIVIALLFLVFDVEVAFLIPWAVVLEELRVPGLVEMGVFILILLVGFAYAWGKGGFQWE